MNESTMRKLKKLGYTFQVLGSDLETPVSFVVCWTIGGKISGGTGQALRIAKDLGIPIFNLENCLVIVICTHIILN